MTPVLLAAQPDAAEIDGLRETVRSACERAGGTRAARAMVAGNPPGFDAALWEVLSGRIGLACVGLSEAAGGAGGLAEVTAVSEELGRVLAPVPFLSSTVLSGQLLAACAGGHDDARDKALAAVAGGEVYTVACAGPAGWDPQRPTVAAEVRGAEWRLSGRAVYVLDAPGAVGLLVVVAGPDGVEVALVDPAVPGVHIAPMRTLDPSRGQATITFADAPATPLTTGGRGAAAVRAAMDVALVALAAEQLGGAQACLDMTVEYVKQRRQFGRPVGSFQAVKHRCADLLVAVETARSAVERAVQVRTAAQLSEAAAVAKVWCGEAFTTVAAECLQLHGGMGFTWEHDIHLYLRRARAGAALFGSPADHRRRLADLLGW